MAQVTNWLPSGYPRAIEAPVAGTQSGVMHVMAFALILVLRAYDMAGVPRSDMIAAERAAADVLGRARIDLSWVLCQSGPVTDALCDEVPGRSELIVRLIAAPKSSDPALAGANVDTETAVGSLATIYVDRVRSLAAQAGVSAGELMGRAIAHEVGHLLLGSSHSTTGLMRAVWSAAALRREGSWGWRFSGGEAERLRRNLLDRIDAGSIARAALVEPVPPRPCAAATGFVCPAR